MNVRKFNCHKIFEAPRLLTRVRILQELTKTYPNRLTISKLQEVTSEPCMTIWFNFNKLRESNLVELNGSRRGFRGPHTSFNDKVERNEIHLEEIEQNEGNHALQAVARK